MSAVPGGIAPESLTFTPLDDMVFLKWEEPVEPNGLITQYEVGTKPYKVHMKDTLFTLLTTRRAETDRAAGDTTQGSDERSALVTVAVQITDVCIS